MHARICYVQCSENGNLLSPSKLCSSTPFPLSDTSTNSIPLSFSLTSAWKQNNWPNVALSQAQRFLMLSSLELTNISGTSINAVLHQLLHSCAQTQHHLSRADLMHRLFVYSLYGSSRIHARILKYRLWEQTAWNISTVLYNTVVIKCFQYSKQRWAVFMIHVFQI